MIPVKAVYCAAGHNVRLGNTPEVDLDEGKAVMVADFVNRVLWVHKVKDNKLVSECTFVPFETINCAKLDDSAVPQEVAAAIAEVLAERTQPKAAPKVKKSAA